MPVVIEPRGARPPRSDFWPGTQRIDIGFVNNMADSGFEATERRFAGLLEDAAGDVPVFLYLYALPSIDRFERARERAQNMYWPLDALCGASFDAVIVTGTEPRRADLRDEPYWSSLTEVIDWAERNTISTIFSCLAAHAAVLHRDGIPRYRLARKCAGVFEEAVSAGHPLTLGISRVPMPHSRWNNLREADVADAGYSVLMKSADAGVGAFVKQSQCLSVFFQSHFEYHADTLLREYRRDIRRYLRGECPAYPDAPLNYFDEATSRLAALSRDHILAAAGRAAVVPDCAFLDVEPLLHNSWRAAGVGIYRNWLRYILAVKQERSESADTKARHAELPQPAVRLRDLHPFDPLRTSARNRLLRANFCRYARDCGIYVRSRRAGERVVASITQSLTRKIRPKLNDAKSAVAPPAEHRFFRFCLGARRVPPKAFDQFQTRIRDMMRRTRGIGLGT